MEITLKQMQLQPRLDAILAEAATVDTELAAAINMATGAAPIPDAGPPVGPDGLTPTQVASEANKNRLEEQLATTQARVDDLQRRFDELHARPTWATPASRPAVRWSPWQHN